MSSPHSGGCWYCWQTDGELLFSTEFDTFVHAECIKDTLEEDPDDLEAEIMFRELCQE